MSDDATTEHERAEDAPRSAEAEAPGDPLIVPEHVRSLRLGHGANCSSVGSVIDTLFLSAAVGGAIFAAICAAMRDEPVRVVGEAANEETNAKAEEDVT